MESSSEDGSFVWTDASNSTSSEDMVMNTGEGNSGGDESEYDKSYKKKLHKKLFTNENGQDTEVRSKKRKHERCTSGSAHSETVKKKIKMEPESDLDIAKVEDNDNRDVVNGYNEHLLDEKVKKEQEFLLPSDNVKKKKRKKSISNENVDMLVKLDTENEAEEKLSSKCNIDEDSLNGLVCEAREHHDQYNVTKKKKKKSEKRAESRPAMEIDNNYQNQNVQHQSSKSKELRKKKSTKQTENHSVTDQTRDYDNSSQDLTIDCTTGDIDISEISKISNVNITQDESILIQTNKGRRKLSQRIQFEDDVIEPEPSRPTVQLPATAVKTDQANRDKLKRFADKQRLKTCVVMEPTEFTIGQGDDVWMVTCPSEVDVATFVGRSLELGGRCKVKLGGAAYEGAAVAAGAGVAVAVAAGLRRVPLAGRLVLHRRLPRTTEPPAPAPAPSPATVRVPLPDTKIRHPLLGAHYKKALKLPPAVKERLHAVPRKRRRTSATPPDSSSAPVHSKKKAKRKKHDLESAETWESERAIEESLFDF